MGALCPNAYTTFGGPCAASDVACDEGLTPRSELAWTSGTSS